MATGKGKIFTINLTRAFASEGFLLLILLAGHAAILRLTHFTDWPETLFYPWLLSNGFIPYRDLVLAYTPLGYTILQSLYHFTGYTREAPQFVSFVFIMLTDTALYALSRRVFGHRLVTVSVMVFFMFWHTLLEANSLWYETMLLPFYLAVFLTVREYLRQNHAYRLVVTGLLFGVMFLIKQTSFTALLVTVAYLALRSGGYNKAVRTVLLIAVPAAVPYIGIAWFYLSSGILPDFIFWTIRFLFILPGEAFRYTLPVPLSDLRYIFPSFIPVAGCVCLALKYRKLPVSGEVFYLALLTGAAFLSGSTRWSLHKIHPYAAFAAMSLGYVYLFIKSKSPTRSVRKFFVVLLIAYNLLTLRSASDFLTVRHRGQNSFFGARYETLVRFIRTTIGSEPYFVYGDLDYVYLGTGLLPLVKPYVPMFPWHWQIDNVEELIIRSLESSEVRYVISIPYHPDKPLYLGIKPTELDSYIRTRYRVISDIPVGGQLLERIK